MRIVVIGTSGAGKTTLARAIAARLSSPHVELDAINWQSDQRDLTSEDPDEFAHRVAEAIRPEAWVVDGNCGPMRDGIWTRATHLVWLDYGRPLIMARVIRRSLKRAALRTEPWAGNRERWSQLVRSGHPVRWAREAEERLARPEYARVTVLRLRHPREKRKAIERLAGELLMRTPST